MSTAYLNPNGDGSSVNWTASGGSPYYPYVSKGVQNPTTPSTASYIGPDRGVTDEFLMETISDVDEVTSISVWLYGFSALGIFTSQPAPYRFSLFLNGSWVDYPIGFEDMPTSSAWVSQTFTGSWTQADIDALQVRIEATDDSGPGSQATVYAIYAELTYTASGGGGGLTNWKTWNTVPAANIKTYNTIT